MSAILSSPTRRSLLAIGAAAGAYSLLPEHPVAATTDGNAIRPFHVNVPEEQLVDLRRRVKATRWPDKETVTDPSQGVQFATIQKLARYWQTDHDWRKVEARLNALPQFITAIDGLDIHFIHVRSKHENALPPWDVGLVNGSMIFNCSMIEPGQPWVTIIGRAFSCFERT